MTDTPRRKAARRPPGKAALAALVLAAAALSAGLAASSGSSSNPTVELLVGFHQLPQDREEYRGEPVTFVAADLGYLLVETDEPERLRSEARGDERVRYVEENRRDYHLAFTPNDTRFPDQYGPQITNTTSAWDTTLGSTAVKLGLLDSGITASHEDFVDSRVSGHDYENGDSTPDDAAGCDYHGSHVAGTAAAATDNGEGIAGMSESSVVMHKIFGNDGAGGCDSAGTSGIAQALKDLGDKGAHISSNSWTTTQSSTTLNDAIRYAHDKGVIHVAAAGNAGPCTDCVLYPWRDMAGIVTVVSCTDENDDFCSFSSQGPEVDLAGPGNRTLSVDGGTTTGYKRMSGTSMSTPHVSGAVGLFIAAHGDADYETIESRLAGSADDVGLPDAEQGGGRLDAHQLVDNELPSAAFTWSCETLECTFDGTNSSDPDGSIESYGWEFGDGATGSGATINYTYSTGGNYTVTLTVTDDGGATNSTNETIHVNEPPTAAFTVTCSELTCTLDGGDAFDDDGSIVGYDWAFGDGNTSTGEVVNHTYEDGGNYTVNLTVTDDDGATDETAELVDVNEPPEANFTWSCEGVDCSFDATNSSDPDGSVSSFAWEFGDGDTGVGETVDHIYDEAGDYTVNLTVTDDEDGDDTTSQVVDANALPTASFDWTCSGLECRFNGSYSSDSDGTITSYDWEFGDGTTGTGEIVNHTYAEGGVYVVNLTVTDDDGATDTFGIEVDVNEPPNASFTASCTQLTCTFNASNSSDPDGVIDFYDWTFGDGNTGAGETVTHTYDENGTYVVNLTVTDDDWATDTANATVTVDRPPMHVHSIRHEDGPFYVAAHVAIRDADGAPVSNADVTARMCNTLDRCVTRDGQTSADGNATLYYDGEVPVGRYTTCVQDVTHSAVDYRPSDDHARDGNCAMDLLLPPVPGAG